MPKMAFKKIGTGVTSKTKVGKPTIHLMLDKKAQKLIESHDFENGIYIFEKTNSLGETYFDVCCPVPETYQINYDGMAKTWAGKFQDKHKKDTKAEFEEWTNT